MAQDENNLDAADYGELTSITSPQARKPKLTRTRRIIPESWDEHTDDEGNKILKYKPEQVANSLSHLHDDIARNHKSTINCEFSAPGSDGHTGKATHFVRLPGQPREGTYAVCQGHAKLIAAAGMRKGDEDLEIKPINIRHVRSWKILQAQNREEVRTYLEAALRSQGMRGEDELFAPKGPGGRKPHVPEPKGGILITPGSGAPLMAEDEAAEYNSERRNAARRVGAKKTEYSFKQKPLEVKPGNKAPVAKVKDPMDQKPKHRGGFTKAEDKVGESSVAITIPGWKPRPDRLERAIDVVGAEQAERAIQSHVQAKQARKQQGLQQRKVQEFGIGNGTAGAIEG